MLLAAAKKRQIPRVLALFLCLSVCACSRGQQLESPSAQLCAVDPALLRGYSVERVSDGDTLRLAGGEKVRLIGINTPEMGRGGAAAEPFAEPARDALHAALDDGRAWLVDGVDSRDAYGRRLAAVYDARGNSIAALLLSQGMGFHVAIAPNLGQAGCLAAAEADARQRRTGVWGVDRYRPRSAGSLPPKFRGFALLEDRVTRVSFKDNGWWVQLGGKIGVKIAPPTQHLYSRDALRALEGRTVQARGWLVPMSGDWWVLSLGSPQMMQPFTGKASGE